MALLSGTRMASRPCATGKPAARAVVSRVASRARVVRARAAAATDENLGFKTMRDGIKVSDVVLDDDDDVWVGGVGRGGRLASLRVALSWTERRRRRRARCAAAHRDLDPSGPPPTLRLACLRLLLTTTATDHLSSALTHQPPAQVAAEETLLTPRFYTT